MNGRDAEAVLLLADLLVKIGKPTQAVDLLRGLTAAGTDDVRVPRLLVKALLDTGRYAAAEPVAERLVATAATGDRAAALFFHAHALWGIGKIQECRQQIERYTTALASEADSAGRTITG